MREKLTFTECQDVLIIYSFHLNIYGSKENLVMKKIPVVLSLITALVLVSISSIPSYAYNVKEGDTLSRISIISGVPLSKLKELNNISDPNKIYVGQEIILEGEGYTRFDRSTINSSSRQKLRTLFDAEWYRKSYPDVIKVVGDSDDALFNHYLQYGLWETRQPNADFNVNAYYMAYDDLQESYKNMSNSDKILNLSLHYATYGKQEKREITTIKEYCDKKSLEGYHSIEIINLNSKHGSNNTSEAKIIVETNPGSNSTSESGSASSSSSSVSTGSSSTVCAHIAVIDTPAVTPSLGGYGYTAQSHCSICGEVLSTRTLISNDDALANIEQRLASWLTIHLRSDDGSSPESTTFENTQMYYIGSLVNEFANYWGISRASITSSSSNNVTTYTIPRSVFEEATAKMFGKSFYSTYSSGNVFGYNGEDFHYDVSSDTISVNKLPRGGYDNTAAFTDLTINGNQYVYEITVSNRITQAYVESWTLTATLTSDGCLRFNSLSKN